MSDGMIHGRHGAAKCMGHATVPPPLPRFGQAACIHPACEIRGIGYFQASVSFGMGRRNTADDAPVDHPLFRSPSWDAVPAAARDGLRSKARITISPGAKNTMENHTSSCAREPHPHSPDSKDSSGIHG